ncbi:hypothetical protein LCGC14_1877450, partial [marine sediment metagenome]
GEALTLVGNDASAAKIVFSGNNNIEMYLTTNDDYFFVPVTDATTLLTIGAASTQYWKQILLQAKKGSPDIVGIELVFIEDKATDETTKLIVRDGVVEIEGTNVTPRFEIPDGANIGIASDTDLLQLASGALTVNGTIGCGDVTTTGDYLLANGNYVGVSAAERIEFYTAGYVAVMGARFGVGTASPGTDLEIQQAGTNSQSQVTISTFNDQVGYNGSLDITKSHSDTGGTLTATINTEIIGQIRFRGVDSTPDRVNAVLINAVQNGAASATSVPTDLFLETYGDSVRNFNQLVLHHDGNVGIGTTEPTLGKLQVSGTISQTDDQSSFLNVGRYSSGDSNAYIRAGASDLDYKVNLAFRVRNAAGTEFTAMSIDGVSGKVYSNYGFTTGGNVGIGDSSLESWAATYTALEIGGQTALWGITAEQVSSFFYLGHNIYNDGAWKRQVNDEGTLYGQGGGSHTFWTVASGAADTSFNPVNLLSLGPTLTTFNNPGNDVDFVIDASGVAKAFLVEGSSGSVVMNNTAPDSKTTLGLTINQGANDDAILSWQSSDIAHGTTTLADTETYGTVRKVNATTGALQILGLSQTGDTYGIVLRPIAGSADTTTSGAAVGALHAQSELKSGTGSTAFGVNDNIVVFGSSTNAVHIFKGDGDIYTDTDQTSGLTGTYDDEDDMALVNAAKFGMAGVYSDVWKQHTERLNELGIMKGSFVSHNKMNALQLGTLGQLHAEIQTLKQEIAELQSLKGYH